VRTIILRNGITHNPWPVVETTGNGEKPLKGFGMLHDPLSVVETTAYCEKLLKGYVASASFFSLQTKDVHTQLLRLLYQNRTKLKPKIEEICFTVR